MNSEESKRKSLEEAQREIEFMKREIASAIERGETQIRCDYLHFGTKLWLKENGYRYSEYSKGTRIYWK